MFLPKPRASGSFGGEWLFSAFFDERDAGCVGVPMLGDASVDVAGGETATWSDGSKAKSAFAAGC
jgi:hypothetical protein